MNTKGVLESGARYVDLDTTGAVVLGDGAEGVTSSMTIQIEADGGGWSGSIVIKARIKGSTATWQPIPYRRLNLAGTVSDNTYVSAALTGSGVHVVEPDGLEVELDYTHASGAARVYFAPLRS